MMSSQYQEAGDYSMCFHVCNHHRPRIGRNLPTKRAPWDFASESRHIQLCQNLRCFFFDAKNGVEAEDCDLMILNTFLWFEELIRTHLFSSILSILRSNETADLPKQSTAKRTASKITSLLYGCRFSKRLAVMKRNPSMIWPCITTYFLVGFPNNNSHQWHWHISWQQ